MDHKNFRSATENSMDHRISSMATENGTDHKISVWATENGMASKKKLGLLNVAIRTTMGLSRLGLVSANQPEQVHNSTSSVARKR